MTFPRNANSSLGRSKKTVGFLNQATLVQPAYEETSAEDDEVIFSYTSETISLKSADRNKNPELYYLNQALNFFQQIQILHAEIQDEESPQKKAYGNICHSIQTLLDYCQQNIIVHGKWKLTQEIFVSLPDLLKVAITAKEQPELIKKLNEIFDLFYILLLNLDHFAFQTLLISFNKQFSNLDECLLLLKNPITQFIGRQFRKTITHLEQRGAISLPIAFLSKRDELQPDNLLGLVALIAEMKKTLSNIEKIATLLNDLHKQHPENTALIIIVNYCQKEIATLPASKLEDLDQIIQYLGLVHQFFEHLQLYIKFPDYYKHFLQLLDEVCLTKSDIVFKQLTLQKIVIDAPLNFYQFRIEDAKKVLQKLPQQDFPDLKNIINVYQETLDSLLELEEFANLDVILDDISQLQLDFSNDVCLINLPKEYLRISKLCCALALDVLEQQPHPDTGKTDINKFIESSIDIFYASAIIAETASAQRKIVFAKILETRNQSLQPRAFEKAEPEIKMSSSQKETQSEIKISFLQNATQSEIKISSPQNAIQPEIKIRSPQNAIQPAIKISSPQNAIQPTIKISSPQNAIQPEIKIRSPQNAIQPAIKISSPQNAIQPTIKISSPQNAIQPEIKISSPQNASPKNSPKELNLPPTPPPLNPQPTSVKKPVDFLSDKKNFLNHFQNDLKKMIQEGRFQCYWGGTEIALDHPDHSTDLIPIPDRIYKIISLLDYALNSTASVDWNKVMQLTQGFAIEALRKDNFWRSNFTDKFYQFTILKIANYVPIIDPYQNILVNQLLKPLLTHVRSATSQQIINLIFDQLINAKSSWQNVALQIHGITSKIETSNCCFRLFSEKKATTSVFSHFNSEWNRLESLNKQTALLSKQH